MLYLMWQGCWSRFESKPSIKRAHNANYRCFLLRLIEYVCHQIDSIICAPWITWYISTLQFITAAFRQTLEKYFYLRLLIYICWNYRYRRLILDNCLSIKSNNLMFVLLLTLTYDTECPLCTKNRHSQLASDTIQ